MKLHALVALAIIVCFLGATACSSVTGGDAVVIAVESAPKSLDPRLGSIDSVSARLHQMVFDSLVRKNERFEYVPHLAESFTQSDDAKTFTFKLRPGIKTHSGRDLTSADVKWTYESIASPDLKSPVAAAFGRIATIETPDALTAVFQCREPYQALLGDLMAVPVMIESPAGALPLGTGPFKVIEAGEQTVELEAHPGYFLGAPKVSRLRVRVIPDNNTRELELKSGGVDLAINSGFAPDTVAKMQTDSDLQVVNAPGTNIAHIGFNVNDEVLRDAKVRRALAQALNRDQIIATVMQGQARTADGIMPPESWAYDAEAPKTTFDPEAAKRLLDEAGHPDPDGDGPAFRFTIGFTTTNSGTAPAIAQIVQEQWKAVGVGVNAEQFERVTFFDRLGTANFDSYYIVSVGANQTPDVFAWAYYPSYWGPDRKELDAAAAKLRAAAGDSAADPAAGELMAILDRRGYCPSAELDSLIAKAKGLSGAEKRTALLSACDLLTSRGAGNRMRYCNPALAEDILKAERSHDRSEQLEIYKRIQKTIAGERPQIYLWYTANVIVARKRIGNIDVDPSGAWYFLQGITSTD